MISATGSGTGPTDDHEWDAAPTHPESDGAESATTGQPDPDDDWAAEEPLADGSTADAEGEWDSAPALPLGIPKSPPKPKRERSGSRRDRRTKPDEEQDRPPREPKADRPPPTAEERLQIALKHAYRYLTKRDRTAAEVRTHLEKRETDPASLEAAIAELLELRYLDDERYVQRYVEDRRRLDGWGPVRITQGLRKTGIDKALIAPAIAAVAEESEDDDVTLATELVQRRFNHRPLDGDKDRQKALRAVIGKGHSLDVAYAAVRAYEERCAEEAGD